MNKDTIAGSIQETGGKIRQKVGSVTGDKKGKALGAKDRAVGKARKAVGKVKDALD